MNYTILLTDAGEPYTPLTAWEAHTDFDRPVLNSLFEYKFKLYRVYACLPATNPGGMDVQYYVTIENPDTPYKQGLTKPSYYGIAETEKLMDV